MIAVVATLTLRAANKHNAMSAQMIDETDASRCRVGPPR